MIPGSFPGRTPLRPGRGHVCTIYVAPAGDDNGAGTESDPLASLPAAVDRAEVLSATCPVSVVLREGTHYLTQTLVIRERPEGNHRIDFRAAPGERPTISGAARLDLAWKKLDGEIHVAHVRSHGIDSFDQLFVDGQRQVRARFPNGHPQSPLLENFAFIEDADEREYPDGTQATSAPPLPHRELYYSDDMFSAKRWSHPEDGIIHIFPRENWNALQFRLRGIDYERKTILLGEGGYQQHERFAARPGTMLDRTSRFYIENIREELDAPGEWFFDRRSGELFFFPPPATQLETATFEVPQLRELVRFEGTRDHLCRDIGFHGIRFTGTTTTFLGDYEVVSFGDWAIVRSGAVVFENAVRCIVEDCYFDAVGGNAIFINRFNDEITVCDCLVTECGESGIAVVGSSMLRRDRSSTCEYCGEHRPWGFGEHTDDYPRGCVIENNLIHDVGTWGKQTAAVFMSVTADNRIAHNEFYNIPRAAMCIHDGTFGGHVIEHNYMHHTCRDTDEHGTFNSWGRDTWWCHAQSHQGKSHPAGDVFRDALFQTVIRNNRFLDFSGWCIDLDDGSSNYDIYNNVSIGGGIKTREGDFRKVHNNIVYLPTIDKPTAIQVGNEGNSDVWYNNIIFAHRDCIHLTRPPANGKVVRHCDRNVYYSGVGAFASRGMGFEEWRAQGIDSESIYADPQFRDPERGDFTVGADSPALRLGFVNFPQDEFGTVDFPDTWADLERHFPLYDYDTMNRKMLKNIRLTSDFVSPDERGTMVLDAEEGRTESPSVYQWRLRYLNGGTYDCTVHYTSLAESECAISAFVESIGEEVVRQTLPIARSSAEEKIKERISLSGEDTDIVQLTLRVTPQAAGFSLRYLLLAPESGTADRPGGS